MGGKRGRSIEMGLGVNGDRTWESYAGKWLRWREMVGWAYMWIGWKVEDMLWRSGCGSTTVGRLVDGD